MVRFKKRYEMHRIFGMIKKYIVFNTVGSYLNLTKRFPRLSFIGERANNWYDDQQAFKLDSIIQANFTIFSLFFYLFRILYCILIENHRFLKFI